MIKVELSAAEITIEPGSTAQLTVTVTNEGAEPDHLFLEIEGIDVEWYALPVPSLTLAPGTSQTARVLFKVARASSSTAGTYPFIVRVRSMETGDSGVQPATLVVKPFNALQIELNPKRTASTFFRHAPSVDVVVSNLSNHEDTLDLFGSEPDDACAFEFEKERVTVKPGHTETVGLNLEPVTRAVLGGSRLYGYTVTARSVRDSFVSGTAHGQLERRALLSTVTLISAFAIILGLIVYVAMRPRPAIIHKFDVTPRQITIGQSVNISWNVTGATDGILILPDNQRSAAAEGSYSATPVKNTEYTIVAKYAGGKEVRESAVVIVTPPPPVAPPKITAFDASSRRVHQGDEVTLSWKCDNVKTVMLNPLGGPEREYPLYTSQTVKPEKTTTYDLAVKGTGGTISKSLKIEVVKPTESIAEIKSFRAKPAEIIVGSKSTLSWTASNVSSVEIDNGVGAALQPSGRFEVSPQTTTTYTLRAIDDRGNAVTKTVTLTVKPPPPPPTDNGISPGENPGKPPPPIR